MQELTMSQTTGSLPKLVKQHKKWALDCFFYLSIPPDCFNLSFGKPKFVCLVAYTVENVECHEVPLSPTTFWRTEHMVAIRELYIFFMTYDCVSKCYLSKVLRGHEKRNEI